MIALYEYAPESTNEVAARFDYVKHIVVDQVYDCLCIVAEKLYNALETQVNVPAPVSSAATLVMNVPKLVPIGDYRSKIVYCFFASVLAIVR